MKTNSPIALIFLLLIFQFFSSCMQKASDVSNEIKAANQEMMKAFGAGDAKGVSECYTTNGKLFPANSNLVDGRSNIEGFWKAVMGMGIKKVVLETSSAEGTAGMAVEEGRYKLYAGEDQMVDEGKYIVAWKKEDGKWKLHQDIWNTNHPAPAVRAVANDPVWIFLNPVKANMVAQFEDFNFKYLEPATNELYPNMKATTRLLKPSKPNKDGTFTYVYLMDPATSPEGYDMSPILSAKYGADKAKEYYKMFTDCLKDGKQESIVAVQTKW